jgi:ribonuclease T2
LWPQDCPIKGRAFVPRPIIDGMLDIMPSDKLVIHEYRKHGTCSGLDPAGYFNLSRKLFSKVVIPNDYTNPMEAKFVSPADLLEDFRKVNPWLKPDMVAVTCGGPGNQLTDVRICFTKDGAPTSCSRNEDQKRSCNAPKMYLPPVRATRLDAPAKDPNPAMPRPKLIPNARNI